jgi:hypothetical protein
VLKDSQGHPEVGVLWEKHINKILDDLDRREGRDDKTTTSLSLAPLLLRRKLRLIRLEA